MSSPAQECPCSVGSGRELQSEWVARSVAWVRCGEVEEWGQFECGGGGVLPHT